VLAAIYLDDNSIAKRSKVDDVRAKSAPAAESENQEVSVRAALPKPSLLAV